MSQSTRLTNSVLSLALKTIGDKRRRRYNINDKQGGRGGSRESHSIPPLSLFGGKAVTNQATRKCKLCNVKINEDRSDETAEWVKERQIGELDGEAIDAIIKVIFGKQVKLNRRSL